MTFTMRARNHGHLLGLKTALMLSSAVLVGGCVWDGPGREVPAAVPPAGAVVASPFSPAGIRVLPLTHFERTADGEPRVMVFFELIDQWGDTVKGAGSLEIRVRSGEGPSARTVEWAIDLADLKRNASLYDPSTRAYRLALKDLPDWLRVIASDRGNPDRAPRAGVDLEVFFTTLGSDGQRAVLRDRFLLAAPG